MHLLRIVFRRLCTTATQEVKKPKEKIRTKIGLSVLQYEEEEVCFANQARHLGRDKEMEEFVQHCSEPFTTFAAICEIEHEHSEITATFNSIPIDVVTDLSSTFVAVPLELTAKSEIVRMFEDRILFLDDQLKKAPNEETITKKDD
ncbi:hypothetical protein LSH36_285g02069 [Paralvinella palmiformis]|uniref:Uncharacterized protein n=1 Tax=Paralvinella palmiformis TaxID=53620 RepID=A0AAD9N380_9ANNE|nr:hypothetical protein LSH36_285g02069 [Paralvinella palmiformis]